MKPIAIGTEDFKEIIESGSLFIDKTLFIKELIDNTSKAICLPRPRRFGKSVNMSMLDYYFNLKYKGNTLFKGLKIMNEGEKYLNEMNKYPVVSLSLKDTKKITFEGFLNDYKTIMANLYLKYENILMNSKVLTRTEKKRIKRIIDEKEDNPERLPNLLSYLVNYLSRCYGLQVIVLLDEYDAPILHAYEMGYYDEMITFIKQLFVTTFKDNRNLKKGVITGISRISKENLFSDANNINVYNITDERFSTHFGFTENEVKWVLKEYNLSDTFDDVKRWYDGYLFDENIIYNPWSILKYLENPKHALQRYWVKTGSIDLLKSLVYKLSDTSTILGNFHDLIEDGKIEHVFLDTDMDLKSLRVNKNTIWTLFMLSGYLTPTKWVSNPEDVTLRIPNLEVKKNLESMANSWLDDLELDNIDFIEFLKNKELDKFKKGLESVVECGFSYYDVPSNQDGENFYHAFVMGILYNATNSTYKITSNRESGLGRYDLLLKPINNSTNNAYIIEFKLVKDNNFDKVIEDAFKQIDEHKYEVEVKNYNVTKMVIAFRGKKVKIETR